MAKSQPELAYLGAIHRTIPANKTDFAFTAADSAVDLSAFSGKWIYLRALTANVGVLRTASVLTALNDGYPINTTDAMPQEFFVDASDPVKTLRLFGAGGGTLRIYWD